MSTILNKYYLPMAIATLLLSTHAMSQPCAPGVRIQSAVVEKPAEVQASVLNCKTIVLNWPGNPNQSYILNVDYSDNTSITLPTIDRDGRGNCSAAIALKPATTLSWSIQAIQVVDGRTFYSYPLRGESSGCAEDQMVEVKPNVAAVSKFTTTEAAATKPSFTVYPNPVTGELTIKWSSDYTGNARLTIIDASGRTVKLLDLKKQLPHHLDRIAVSTLAPGLYYLHLRMQNGRSVSTNFVKK